MAPQIYMGVIPLYRHRYVPLRGRAVERGQAYFITFTRMRRHFKNKNKEVIKSQMEGRVIQKDLDRNQGYLLLTPIISSE
jgi:hypothetical protein